jgi:hypothetical protein
MFFIDFFNGIWWILSGMSFGHYLRYLFCLLLSQWFVLVGSYSVPIIIKLLRSYL